VGSQQIYHKFDVSQNWLTMTQKNYVLRNYVKMTSTNLLTLKTAYRKLLPCLILAHSYQKLTRVKLLSILMIWLLCWIRLIVGNSGIWMILLVECLFSGWSCLLSKKISNCYFKSGEGLHTIKVADLTRSVRYLESRLYFLVKTLDTRLLL